MLKTYYIATAGTIGSGKTTVAKLIAKELNFHLILENFGENRFLPRFYKNMSRWAFHSQTFYLMEKINQMLESKKILKTKSIVQDTPIYQDVLSYAKAQFISGNMDDAEFALYTKIYTSFLDLLPKPDLTIYLKVKIETLQKRILQRARSFEQNIPIKYLQKLDDLNKVWLRKQPKQKVLVMDAEKNNFSVNKKHMQKLVSIIKSKLNIKLKTENIRNYSFNFKNNKLSNFKVFLMCGMPGVGKTTIAKKLAKQLNAVYLSSDNIRKKLFNSHRFDNKGDNYILGIREKYYAELFLQAKKQLLRHNKVILDASNMDGHRQKIIKKLKNLVSDGEILMIVVKTPKEIIKKRIKKIKKMANGQENYLKAWQRVFGYFENHLQNGEYSWPKNKEGIEIININNGNST